ncbi:hypothetical protein MVEN_00678600 [Mycena venus]|uniref:Uncharacterized protein n=1 Tax=Mycena venus TaxID=2733690 RepID=A0A8H6YLD7_9AGAR|nr:hypothetical protein MVEN_00678600 [Mycena venus]
MRAEYINASKAFPTNTKQILARRPGNPNHRMHTFILLATAALLTLTSADQARRGYNDISTVFTTVTLPAFTVIDNIVPAATITGTATIDDGVTIINDGETLYMIGTAGNQVKQVRGGLSGTNTVNGVTVVNGQIVGTTPATTTRDDDGSGGAKTGSSTTPTGGAMRAMATAEVLGVLGLGAMAALIV